MVESADFTVVISMKYECKKDTFQKGGYKIMFIKKRLNY